MTTIPAKELANVNPSVLSAGGSALDIIGLFLTTSARIPIGDVHPFPDADSVGNYFGDDSDEKAKADVYFGGFTNAGKRPASLLMTQYPSSAVSAYLRGGDVSAVPLATLQGYSGLLSIVADGSTHAANINLAAATSFSSAAALVQTGLNTAVSVTGSVDPNIVTGTIAPNVGTGSISGTTMTISAVSTGAYAPGQTVSGTSVVAGTTIVAQLTGTAGSTGTYQVSVSQTVASTTLTASGGTLNATAVTSGAINVGQTLTGSGVTAGTTVTAFLTGTGGTGKYAVSASQTVGSTAITGSGGLLTVTAVSTGTLAVGDVIAGTGVTVGNKITALKSGTGGTGTYFVSVGDSAGSTTITVSGAGIVAAYDSVSGGFTITSGTTGAASTMAFATGALAANLLLRAADGAVLSQGAAAASPGAFMDDVVDVTTDWVTFMTLFNPDATGSANKQAFAAWNTAQNDRYAYVCWDTDTAPTLTVPAAASLGQILEANGDSGTALVWVESSADYAAFVCGAAASIDFEETNGRISFAYKAQAGLVGDVSSAEVANNLGGSPQTANRGNGYNFYGAYGAANSSFLWLQRGFVTGPFAWLDSYVNQIWLNNQFQLAGLTLQQNARSIPYTVSGAALIEAAYADPIAAGLNFGAFAPGEISAAQIAEVNAQAGAPIAASLQAQGYYLQVKQATSATRAARTSPPCKFWYLDRGSVQALDLDSIALQ